MTWFHIPKKKIVLECITSSEAVAKYATIGKAGKFLPKWWKDIAQSPMLEQGVDMRGCVGMTDMFSRGFMLPLWSDLRIQVGPKNSGSFGYQYADKKSFAEPHAAVQRGGFHPEPDFFHLKLVSPWHIKCEEDVNFIFMQPTWNLEKISDFEILNGVVNFKYQHTVNVNMMFERMQDKDRTINIPLGQPLAHIIPLDPRPIEIKIVADLEKYNKISELGHALHFHDAYKKKKAIVKSAESKCPFTGGKK